MISVSILGTCRNCRTFRLRSHYYVIRTGSCEGVSDYGGLDGSVWECEEVACVLSGGGLEGAAEHGVGKGGRLGLV